MAHSYARVAGLIDCLRQCLPTDPSIGDRDLLDRYLATRDERAFAALVKRHGPMVLSVCRRVLRHHQDAEDAFQAVFLVLARKAMTIRRGESITGWLHRVALHASFELRASNARRARRQTTLPSDVPDAMRDEPTLWETQRILEQELDRLPDRYRAALLLCCLQGRTQDEAAQQLGWELGVLRGRLQRGRTLLRARLAQRGIPVSAALLSVFAGVGDAAIVPRLVSSTVRAALAAANHTAASASTPAASLAQGIIHTMFLAKVRSIGIGLLMVALLSSGIGVVAYRVHAEDAPAAAQARRASGDDEVARLKREIEILKLQLSQTRHLLDKANHEIVDLRAARAEETKKLRSEHYARLWQESIQTRFSTIGSDAGVDKVDFDAFVKDRIADDMTYERLLTDLEKSRSPYVWRDAILQAFNNADKPKQGEIHLGVFSPDGKLIAAASEKFVMICDAATFKDLYRFAGHTDMVKSLAFSPDGKLLASGGNDKSVIVWEATTGKQRSKLVQPNVVEAVTFSPDGKRLIIRHKTGTTEIDVESGKMIRKEEYFGPPK